MEIVRSSKRLKNTDEETKDFISELPDHILVHILTFLPIEDAVKTVIIRRFGNLWRSIPVLDLKESHHKCWLDFDGEDCDNEKFLDIIHHVSHLHDVGILDRLSLNLFFALTFSKEETAFQDPDTGDYAEREKATSGDIEKLLGYAINRKVKVLDLNFRGCSIVPPSEFYVLPDVVFRSDWLTDMRLVSCDIESCGEISLKALRILSLNAVSSLCDKVMENILRGCPSVEELSLIDCYGLGKLYCRNPNLKKLMLTVSTEQEMLQVSCPHVMSLEIAGWIERATLVDVSSIIDASVSFSYLFRSELRPYNAVERLLQKISRCKTFTPCTFTILMMTIWNFRNVPCASYQWKNLIIKLYMIKWHHPGLSWLLKSSRSLETLTLYVRPGSDGFFKREASNWISAYDFDGESYWDLQEASFPCLESIIIRGYVNVPYVIQMLKFLLKNATKLQKMVISFEPSGCDAERHDDQFTSEKLLELVQELSTFPRILSLTAVSSLSDKRLLQKISQCKTFTPCGSTIYMLTIWSFIGMPCAPFQWKNLIIKLYLTKWHHPGLLKSSRSLETLTLYIRPGSNNFFKCEASNWISAYDFDGESYWDLQEVSFLLP